MQKFRYVAGVERSDVLTFAKRFARCRTKIEAGMIDKAWTVLTAAIDLGDQKTVEAARGFIDAQLLGRTASQSDRAIIERYFR